MLDLSQQTPAELADIVRAVREEFSQRGVITLECEIRAFRHDCNEVIGWLDESPADPRKEQLNGTL
jgi:hypothetical protein